MNRNVTMKDIAEKLGISIVSVSKALTGKQGVSEELRDKIKKEADRMGYRYNVGARALKEGKNYNIGVIIRSCYLDDTSNAFYLQIYQSVARRLTHYDYATMLELVEPEMQKRLQLPEIVESKRLDGLLVVGELQEEYLERLKKVGLPMVYLDFYDKKMEIDSVSMDNVCAEYDLTEYLIRKGHREIAFVGSIDATTSIMDRYVGYRKALHAYGIPYRSQYLIPDRDIQGQYTEPVFPEPVPTAFVCNNDEVAAKVIDKLRGHNYRVPEDIMVTGFDNYPFVRSGGVGITTVAVDMDTMAKGSVDLLMERLNGKGGMFLRRVVRGRMVLRESTGDWTIHCKGASVGEKIREK